MSGCFTGNRCAILAVDPGEKCGVAIFGNGVLVNYKLLDGYDAVAIGAVIRGFLAGAADAGRAAVLVLERPPRVLYGGKKGGFRSLAGVGSVIGVRKLWEREWKRAGGVGVRVVSVEPPTWRSRIFSHSRGLKSEFLKTLAMNRVQAEYGFTPATSDVAEAVLIGKWATYAHEVAAVLPKPRAPRKPKARVA